MRLARFSFEGREGLGLVVAGGLVDVARHLAAGPSPAAPGSPVSAPSASPAGWDLASALAAPEALRPLASLPADLAEEDVRLLPPLTPGARILCVGVNYDLHRQEMGREVPEHPVIFVRFASSLVGHREALWAPRSSSRFDYEGELAVIVGRGGRHISRERALEHVAGYACFNDGSVRDWQRHTHQFTPGKNFDRSGAFGPHLVTAEEVPDPQALRLTTRVNGELVQDARTSAMTYPVAELIRYASAFMTLEPGDVIATGTPAGVGDKRTPPLYLGPGDRVVVEIEGVGRLENEVALERLSR